MSNRACLRQHDVGGFEIAMDDPLAMRLVERVGDLGGDRQRLVERERPVLEPRGQRLALEMRHDQVVGAIDAADVVDAADVGMIQRSDSSCLAFEAGSQIRIVSDFTRQNLDRHRAIEAGVAGFVDLAHATRAKRAEDFVGAETGAGEKCQRCPPSAACVERDCRVNLTSRRRARFRNNS